MRKKKIDGSLSLQIPAGQANPSGAVGPALGQRGVNIMDFCNKFNDKCKENIKAGLINSGDKIPVSITIYSDKSFSFETKMPPVSFLIKSAAGLPKGSSLPGKESVGSIAMAQIETIAKTKMVDMNGADLDAAMKMVKGTAVSMGIDVVE